MTLYDLLRVGVCPRCRGRQTIDVPDATRPGSTFVEICPRCSGVGQVRASLADPPHNAPLEVVDPDGPDPEIAFEIPTEKK